MEELGFALAEGCGDLLGMLLGSELLAADGRDEKDGTPEGTWDWALLGSPEKLGCALEEGCCELLGM